MSITPTHPQDDLGRTPAEIVLEVEDLSKAFGPTKALDGVSLELGRGTIHALLGGNGSGKSTTIKCLAGVYTADSGVFRIGGREIEAASMSPSAAWEAGLRFVHQQDSTFPDLTVAENLAIGHGFETGRGGRISWRETKRHAAKIIERYGIEARPETPMHELRPAAHGMVAIARALQDQDGAHEGVLVLDEPTASLPSHEVDVLLGALKRFAASGQTIMYVTHRLAEVMKIADKATVFRDGQVVAQLDRGGFDADGLATAIMGRQMERLEHRPVVSAKNRPTMVSARRICGGPITEVDFELRQGEIVGLAGLLGSGRSSLLRMLFGAQPVEGGEVELEGRKVEFEQPHEAMAAGLAYVPEDRLSEAAFTDLSVGENMAIASCGRHFKGGVIRGGAERKEVRELMGRYQIKAPSEKVPLSTLSGGNQQKVILGRWMCRDPKVLLLDEPTQGIDVGARVEIWQLVRQAVEAGAAALVVSSDFEELPRVCDRVLVLNQGRIVGEITGDDLTEDNINGLALVGEEKAA
jgi:ribose transport system ATP-binding protein